MKRLIASNYEVGLVVRMIVLVLKCSFYKCRMLVVKKTSTRYKLTCISNIIYRLNCGQYFILDLKKIYLRYRCNTEVLLTYTSYTKRVDICICITLQQKYTACLSLYTWEPVTLHKSIHIRAELYQYTGWMYWCSYCSIMYYMHHSVSVAWIQFRFISFWNKLVLRYPH